MDAGAKACPIPPMSTGRELFPVTQATVVPAYELIFAPWVKQLALCEFTVDGRRVTARLPEADALKFSAGAVCGQAIMAAIDTVTALAMATGERATRGTTYQRTQLSYGPPKAMISSSKPTCSASARPAPTLKQR